MKQKSLNVNLIKFRNNLAKLNQKNKKDRVKKNYYFKSNKIYKI